MENREDPLNHENKLESNLKPLEAHSIGSTRPKTPRKSRKSYDKHVHGNRWSVVNKVAIKALQGANLSESKVAQMAGVSQPTVHRVWNDPELEDLSPAIVNKVKNGLGGLLYKRSMQGLLSITPEKLEQSSALQLMTLSAIAVEKGRLMEGLSTNNISHGSVIHHIDAEVSKLDSRLQALD